MVLASRPFTLDKFCWDRDRRKYIYQKSESNLWPTADVWSLIFFYYPKCNKKREYKKYMTIALKDDAMFILLRKIGEQNNQGMHSVYFSATDFTGRNLTIADFFGHLDYLNQKQYIEADFKGNAD